MKLLLVEDDDKVRRAKDSANRNLSSLKAALNLAHRDRLVASDDGWKTVTPEFDTKCCKWLI